MQEEQHYFFNNEFNLDVNFFCFECEIQELRSYQKRIIYTIEQLITSIILDIINSIFYFYLYKQ